MTVVNSVPVYAFEQSPTAEKCELFLREGSHQLGVTAERVKPKY